jgi:hypothetical protein
MEKVADEAPAGETPSKEEPPPETSATEAPAPPEESAPEESSARDFSGLKSEMGDAASSDEMADEFTFFDTSQFQDTESGAGKDTAEGGSPVNEEPEASESAPSDTINFSTDYPATSDEIKFSTDGPQGVDDIDFATGEDADSSALSFDDTTEDREEQEASDEFSFEDVSGDDAFVSGDAEEESPTPAGEETSEPDKFFFGDQNPFADDSSSEWEEETASDDTSFDFEEPQFDNNETAAESPAAQSGSDNLQFGEIDFSTDTPDEEAPGFDVDDDFSSASIEQKEEPEFLSPSQESSRPPADDYDDEEPLPAPPPPKKSSLSRILVLLVLLLAILGGAAGFLFIQEGAINLNTIGQYLPFLQEYIGDAQVSSPGDRIGINVSGSSYVKGEAGQMLVIQGAAVNNHPATRSAITIKGVLLDAQGQTLLQQTVFCGNKLADTALKTMTFAAIEEAMNNQFGDSLSNMNVAAGASIPFTIVFRNPPDGLANIKVEVVDSKPGAG